MSGFRKIDPLLLEVFVAIADTGSFAAAAEKVGRTKSAVSMQMKRLEILFERNPIFQHQGRTKGLTVHGEQLLAHARIILQLNDSLWQKMGQTGGPGFVRLGAPDDYAYTLLPNILDRFAKRFPHVQIDVTCEPSEDLSERIGRNELDLAMVTRRPHDDISQTIRMEPIVWATARGKRFNRSEPLPLAMFQPGCVARYKTIEACAKAGRDYRIAYSSPSIVGVLSPVRAGLALAAIAKCSVPDDLEILKPDEELPEVKGIDIALMRGSTSDRSYFVEHLADEIHASLR